MKPAEAERLVLQAALDAERTARERNEMGQFATPPSLADDIAQYALAIHPPDRAITFLEPSLGSGSFYSALLRNLGRRQLSRALGVEIDPRFVGVSRKLWAASGLEVVEGDFTQPGILGDYKSSLLIANPPYVRHHHLMAEDKARLGLRACQETGLKASGLSGLYLYFVLLSHRYLAHNAVCAWLIPAEFMDTNYGRVLREYLSTQVTLCRVHRFDAADVKFGDALVTSTVVVFRNQRPQPGDFTEFSFGGSIAAPCGRVVVDATTLAHQHKWISYFHGRALAHPSPGPVIGDFFRIRRGIATGANDFFILPKAAAHERGILQRNLKPILPSPRYMSGLVVEGDTDGYPELEKKLAVIDCDLPEDRLSAEDPALAAYLADASPGIRESYLVRSRKPWYRQEQRSPAPFVCTYMGRGANAAHPVRFILNRSCAIASNMFLMLFPTGKMAQLLAEDPGYLSVVHQALLSISADDLRHGGRVYGGGLHKLEPKELAALRAERIADVAPR